MPSKPNILLIILDTQRSDHLSLYGYPRPTSPHLEAFSHQAGVFERALSPAQWTIPSHASLFTGLYPSQHGLVQAFGVLSGMYPTLAEILHTEGYQTTAFCNNPLLGILDTGLQRGFEQFYNYAGASPDRPLARYSPLRRQLSTRFRRFARQVSNQFAHNDLLFRISLNPLIVPFWTRLANFKGDTARSTQDLVAYWRQYQAGGQEKPLFMFLNVMQTHTPYRPPQDVLQHIAPELRHDKRAYHYITRRNASAVHWISPATETLEDWQAQALAGFYDAETAYQDALIGQMLHELEQSGALDNTLVIISADHGEGHGDHGYFGHSFVVYQELTHVPLMIRHPDGVGAGKRIPQNVSSRRLWHTILDAAAVHPPLDAHDPNAQVSQRSLLRLLEGENDVEQGIAYSEAIPPLNLLSILQNSDPALVEALRLSQTRRAVVLGDYKLTLVGEQVEHLFNLTQDPLELHDLHAQAEQPSAQLQRLALDFIAQQDARQAHAPASDFSAEVMANLRALGYVE